jgi:hypothetical protein
MAAWGLRKLGLPVPENALGGSQWMEQQGFTRPVPQNALSLAGETFGLVGPMAVAAKARQVAAVLNKAGANAAVPRTLNPQKGAVVYHGSPHKFDAFDSSKIGTGEGAQAYGHGLYLADAPDVAKAYRSNLVKDPSFLEVKTGKLISKDMPEYADLIATQARMERNGYGAVFDKKYQVQEGAIYKVDLPDEQIAKMLDWDKPLSQQAHVMDYVAGQEVKRMRPILEQRKATLAGLPSGSPKEQTLKKQIAILEEEIAKPDASGLGELTGGDYFNYLRRRDVDQVSQADMFKQAGIPGIRYLDGGSRGAGAGTSNYVVFPGEEKNLRILERNGEIIQRFQDRVANLGSK